MAIIAQTKRYLPHEISTKVQSVQLYRRTKDISFVCRRYHISKASLMRWNKLYDGTKESLIPKSHRPYSVHPNAHTAEELRWIMNLHRRNPNISVCEMYSKLREQHAYDHMGFQSLSPDDSEKDDEYMVFYTNTPEEEIEVSTSMVVAWDSALEAAKEFFTTLVKPTCLEWEEL